MTVYIFEKGDTVKVLPQMSTKSVFFKTPILSYKKVNPCCLERRMPPSRFVHPEKLVKLYPISIHLQYRIKMLTCRELREKLDPREHRFGDGAPRGRPPPADAPGTGHHHGGQVGHDSRGHCPRTGPHGHRVPPPRARRRRARRVRWAGAP